MDPEQKETHSVRVGTPHNQSHFKTPEEAAAHTPAGADSYGDRVSVASPGSSKKGLSLKKIHKHLWDKFRDLSTRRKVVVIVVVVLVLGGVVTVSVLALHKKKPIVGVVTKTAAPNKAAPAPTTVPSNLTGLPVAPAINQEPVTGVMIENLDAARPQSGLNDAGVVFEALAEGGITRFLALYEDAGAASVGPIRSLRPYYLGWALGFDAPIAHVGGSPEALSDLSSWGGKDLDEFYNSSAYTRITTRQAPHNVYTSIADLNTLEASKGWTSSTFTGFPRKADAPLKTPTATTIKLTFSSYDYNPVYTYDATTNTYNRAEDGAPFTDEVSGAQISPKVVIAMVVPWAQGALDSSGAYYSEYSYLGSGQVDVFQDGGVTTGTWSKTSNNAQITFTNAQSAPIKLDAGQTWIDAVATASDISYQ